MSTQQEKVMNAFAEQAKTMYTPLRKINALLLENMEKMTDFQLDALRSYSQMGVNQLKGASELKDAESMREYTSTQAEMMSTVSKKVLEDAKTMAEMAVEFKQEVEKIMEEARSTAFTKPGETK
ncbi:phasin family protein [Allopseudospirillum japonicum]|uniref:Phasin family protein n=1 Tax=Allopseudospirillum japonicum TaxID=64971 RepID=A0A1H6RP86_9GAMM|nr:phasin family protein [Allopseudospirillum japonicum]SEI56306.1 phasin family protein [Allopseudospirillum japonicum]